MSEPTKLEICVIDRTVPFVSGCWGSVTGSMISEIEKDLAENPGEGVMEGLPDDAETILVSASYIPEEVDYSLIPAHVINPGYWELDLISIEQVEEGGKA